MKPMFFSRGGFQRGQNENSFSSLGSHVSQQKVLCLRVRLIEAPLPLDCQGSQTLQAVFSSIVGDPGS